MFESVVKIWRVVNVCFSVPQEVEVTPVQVVGRGEREGRERRGRGPVLSHIFVSRSLDRKALYPEL